MAISVENHQFFLPRVFNAPLKGFPWELGTGAGVKILVIGLLDQTRSLTISSAIWIQSTNVTDGWTPGGSKDHAYT